MVLSRQVSTNECVSLGGFFTDRRKDYTSVFSLILLIHMVILPCCDKAKYVLNYANFISSKRIDIFLYPNKKRMTSL